jgi:hypothetical protein
MCCRRRHHALGAGDTSTGFTESHAHLCVCARHVVLLRASPGPAPLQLVSDQALVAVCIVGDSTHHQVQASLISSKEAHGQNLYNANSTCHCSISSQACVRATDLHMSQTLQNLLSVAWCAAFTMGYKIKSLRCNSKATDAVQERNMQLRENAQNKVGNQAYWHCKLAL